MKNALIYDFTNILLLAPLPWLPLQIKIETLFSLFIIFIGTLLTASPLRDITWASEYRKR